MSRGINGAEISYLKFDDIVSSISVHGIHRPLLAPITITYINI